MIDRRDALFVRMAEIANDLELTFDDAERARLIAARNEIAPEVAAEVAAIHESEE
jgi:hypothetical protein